MKLDVIVPVYNEENIIKKFYEKTKEELKGIKHLFIFINDGSSDKTLENLKDIYKSDKECVRIINFSRNFGKEAAIYAGLMHSKNDYTCIIDSDLQQNPKYLVKMYNFLEKNSEYDSICMCQKQKKNRFFQNTFYKIMDKLADIKINNGASDFRMFRKKMVASIIELSEKSRFSKGIFSYVGFNTYYEDYIVEPRKEGKTKWSKKNLFNYAFSGIVAFSTKPLRLATYFGFLSSSASFIYLIILLIKTLVKGKDIPGYASLMCVMLFIGGIQLIVIGIAGEYIGKIYNETKNRPIFITKEKIGFEEDIL